MLAIAGCTTSSGPVGSTNSGTVTQGSAAGSSGTAASLITSPTDTIPDMYEVAVDVQEKDYLGKIDVTFQGGKGQIQVSKIEATLYRSDGRMQKSTVGNKKGDSITLEGTKDPDHPDRVVVFVTFNSGQTYKVADVLSPYRQH
jgi:hypothetical protein